MVDSSSESTVLVVLGLQQEEGFTSWSGVRTQLLLHSGPASGVREYCARWAEMRVRNAGLCACAVSGAAACACGVRTWEYYTGGQHTRWTKAKQRWLCGPAACASAESYRGCSPPLYLYNYSRMMQQVGGLMAATQVLASYDDLSTHVQPKWEIFVGMLVTQLAAFTWFWPPHFLLTAMVVISVQVLALRWILLRAFVIHGGAGNYFWRLCMMVGILLAIFSRYLDA